MLDPTNKVIRRLLEEGAEAQANRSTKIVTRDAAHGYALSEIIKMPPVVAQAIATALPHRVERVESLWLSNNITTIRQSIRRANLKTEVELLTPAEVGNLARSIIKAHGEKWLLIPGPLSGEDKRNWFYLKQFRYVNPDEWSEMTSYRNDQVNNDVEAIETMQVFSRAAKKVGGRNYAPTSSFEVIFR